MEELVKVSQLDSLENLDDNTLFYASGKNTAGEYVSRNLTFSKISSYTSDAIDSLYGISQHSTDIDDLRSDMDAVESTTSEHTSKIAELNNDITSINKSVNSLMTDVYADDGIQKKVAKLETSSITFYDDLYSKNGITAILNTISSSPSDEKYGVIKVGYTKQDDNFPVSVDSEGNAYAIIDGIQSKLTSEIQYIQDVSNNTELSDYTWPNKIQKEVKDLSVLSDAKSVLKLSIDLNTVQNSIVNINNTIYGSETTDKTYGPNIYITKFYSGSEKTAPHISNMFIWDAAEYKADPSYTEGTILTANTYFRITKDDDCKQKSAFIDSVLINIDTYLYIKNDIQISDLTYSNVNFALSTVGIVSAITNISTDISAISATTDNLKLGVHSIFLTDNEITEETFKTVISYGTWTSVDTMLSANDIIVWKRTE